MPAGEANHTSAPKRTEFPQPAKSLKRSEVRMYGHGHHGNCSAPISPRWTTGELRPSLSPRMAASEFSSGASWLSFADHRAVSRSPGGPRHQPPSASRYSGPDLSRTRPPRVEHTVL